MASPSSAAEKPAAASAPQAPDIGVSPVSFGIAALGALSIGVLIGVRHQFKKAKFKFNWRQHSSGLSMIAGAFVAGTGLCAGTFGIGTAIFMSVTGVSSFPEFATYMKHKIASTELIPGEVVSDEAISDECKEVEGMTLEEEIEYFMKKYEVNEEGENEKNLDVARARESEDR